ncbi:MAG TPA: ABC transporter ATP-binding protein [Thermomicrobiales bacterium]|nr:ABC transporter ATP-binding protein [Thermomicrobiales bacterium]
MSHQDAPNAIEMRAIVKRFPGVVANAGVSFAVRRGEIHALLGENGAGKSTLMNILFGLYHPDEGEILVDNKPVHFHSPRDAVEAGLGMVHQHFMLIPRFTVAENVILGSEGKGLVLDRKAAEKRVGELAEQFGLRLDPTARVEDLPVGMQQRVEIVRALYQGGRTLILDEPTALLTPQEVEELYGILERLRAEGGTIIFITHKLREVAAISDRVTVIQRGRTVGTLQTKDTTAPQLAELMVGRNVTLHVEHTPNQPGEVILAADSLRATGHGGTLQVNDLSLTVRAGEIVGICGVEGNGQSELIEMLAGLRKPERGRIQIHGKDVTGASPVRLRSAGLSYVPEDRHNRGLVLDFSLTENMLLGYLNVEPFCNGNRINYGTSNEITEQGMEKFNVRAPNSHVTARTLSGGNQQKLIIARELYRNPEVILAVQPTRGLDVGAIEFVHRQLIAQRDAGKAVLVVSFELDEILDLSDRILVLYGGRIVGEFANGQVDRATLGLLMGGRSLDDREPISAAVA